MKRSPPPHRTYLERLERDVRHIVRFCLARRRRVSEVPRAVALVVREADTNALRFLLFVVRQRGRYDAREAAAMRRLSAALCNENQRDALLARLRDVA